MHGKEFHMSVEIQNYAVLWISEHMKDDAGITVENVLTKKIGADSGGLREYSPGETEQEYLNTERYLHITRRGKYGETCISYPLEMLAALCERSGPECMIRVFREELGRAGLLKGERPEDQLFIPVFDPKGEMPENTAAVYGLGYANRSAKKKQAPTAQEMMAEMDEEDRALFEELRALRKEIALSKSVAPYVIFSNRTLAAMCEQLPVTLEELRELPGVGKKNSAQYGEAFLELIRKGNGIQS